MRAEEVRKIFGWGIWVGTIILCPLSSAQAEEPSAPPPQEEESFVPSPQGEEPSTSLQGKEQKEEPSVPPLQGEERVTLNFEDADIRAVIHSFATALGLPYSPDPRVQGKVTIRTTEPISKQDLLPLFHHILRSNGLAAVKVGDVYQIIPMGEAKTKVLFSKPALSTAEGTAPERQGAEAEDSFVIELVKVKHLAPQEMVQAIQPFVSPGGDIITYAPGNLLIITDLASNVQRLKDIITAFDTSAARESLTRVYRVQHANVEKLGEQIKQILAASAATSGSTKEGSVSVIPLPGLNSVVVITSNPEVFPQVQKWVEELDVPADTAQETHTRLYRLKHASVEKLGEQIKQILTSAATSGSTKENSVSVIPLPGLNSVVVITSNPEVFPQVQKWVEELDVPADTAQETHTRLYRLKHANVEKLGEQIKQILAASAATSGSTKENSVSVIPLPGLNSVVVITSNPEVFPQVQKWVEELDVPADTAQETHTRLYRLKHASVEKLGEQIKQVLASAAALGNVKESSVSMVLLPGLNSVAVITSNPEVFPQVQKWVEELDVPDVTHLKLVGVAIVPGQEAALLLDPSPDGGRLLRVKVGEEVNGYQLVRVERTRVILKGPGGNEVSLPLNVLRGEEAAKAPRMEVAPPRPPEQQKQ